MEKSAKFVELSPIQLYELVNVYIYCRTYRHKMEAVRSVHLGLTKTLREAVRSVHLGLSKTLREAVRSVHLNLPKDL